MTHTNHSGGAAGADTEWEHQGEKYGVKTIAYSFGNHSQFSNNRHILTEEELAEGAIHAEKASLTLQRPWKYIANKPYVKNLLARNWFQVKNADCIYAIGKFAGKSRSLVDGGTGWAVQMAKDSGKQIYFFEQNENLWYEYTAETGELRYVNYIPTLTENFAGIGTREINENGKAAIQRAYERTFNPTI